MSEELCDVIVIGAGLSGLCAARALQKYDLKLCVLEARDRVGGRTFTEKDSSYGYSDLGAGYVGPTQNRVYQLAKDLDIDVYDVYSEGKTVFNFTKSWYAYLGFFVPFGNPLKHLDLNNIIRLLDNMARQVPRHAPWMADKAEEWDSMTVRQFILNKCWTWTAVDTVEAFVKGILAAQTHEVSLLFLLWYINSGGGVMRLASVRDGGQEKKLKGGTQQLSERMAESLGPSVHLSSPVTCIEQSTDTILVTTSKGRQFRAKYVICSVPQPLLNRIQFSPSLPDLKIQLIQRMPMGSIIKTVMFYKTAFWRDKGYNGQVMSNYGPVSYCMDDTKPDGSSPAIMGFILADKARDVVEMTKKERQDFLCKYYAEAFKMEEFLEPEGYIEKNWMEEEYSGGCYTSVLPPGVVTKYSKVLRMPVGRVHFAGTETATEWAGYMDGALQSGDRAAREVLDQMSLRWSESGVEDDSDRIPELPVIERYLPSLNTLLYCTVAASVTLLGITIYPYFTGWRGKIMFYYLDRYGYW